jgi:hypothetical protein
VADVLTFGLLLVIPILVGYVGYRILNHNHDLWSEDIKRMGDDMW